jgi:hypothetical protein
MTGPLFTPTPAELVAMRALLVDLYDIVADVSPGAFSDRVAYEKLIALGSRVELLRLQQYSPGTTDSGRHAPPPASPHLHTSTLNQPGLRRAGQ